MIRLFHASDLHFGAEDRAALDWFAACVERERPDAIIITGDVTMRARAREFAAAAAWLAALPAPVTVEIGNHDMPYFNPYERAFHPYRRFGAMAGAVEAPLGLPGLCVVPLRTTSRAQWRWNWSKGVVRPRCRDAAAAQVAAAVAAENLVLVAAHHPLVETGTRGTAWTKGGNAALDALIGAGAHAILSGHVHDPFDQMHHSPAGSIRMIGAGTLSERVRHSPPGFNAITHANGALQVVARTMG
ncbi:MAG: metallophosphoesterase family protein [Sphingopyxis sp.]